MGWKKEFRSHNMPYVLYLS